MRAEYFIASRLRNQKDLADNASSVDNQSSAAMRVALLAMILGVMVMSITIFVVIGFKQTITDKVTGFLGHIEVVNYDNNSSYETQPILVSDHTKQRLAAIKGVESVTPFITKPAILKTDSEFQAVVMRGLRLQTEGAESEWQFFEKNLTEGSLPLQTNDILLSKRMASMLGLSVDSSVLCYFVQDKVRVRKFHISGIYNTDFSDYDELFIVGDMRQLQKINRWQDDEVSGLAIKIKDISKIDQLTDDIYYMVANQPDENGNFMYVQNAKQMNNQIFSWLELLNMNVVVILVLMFVVAAFNIISSLVILILESVQLIGTLKAMGASNVFVRKIFLIQTAYQVGWGMLIGNMLAFLLCGLQYWTHLLPLDAASYYVSYVPIAFHWGYWLLLNISIAVLSVVVLIVPSSVISHISPAEVMRFE